MPIYASGLQGYEKYILTISCSQPLDEFIVDFPYRTDSQIVHILCNI